MMPIAAHSCPSPKATGEPARPFDWKKSPGPGMSVARRTSVSVPADAPALPSRERMAPPGKALLAQPRPTAPVLPHGHGAPVPSPRQNDGLAGPVLVTRSAFAMRRAPSVDTSQLAPLSVLLGVNIPRSMRLGKTPCCAISVLPSVHCAMSVAPAVSVVVVGRYELVPPLKVTTPFITGCDGTSTVPSACVVPLVVPSVCTM